MDAGPTPASTGTVGDPFEESLASQPFTFIVGPEGKQFYIHKHVISQLSPVLNALVNGSMKEAHEGRVAWPDLDVDTFVRFAMFAYKGDYNEPEPVIVHEPQLDSPEREIHAAGPDAEEAADEVDDANDLSGDSLSDGELSSEGEGASEAEGDEDDYSGSEIDDYSGEDEEYESESDSDDEKRANPAGENGEALDDGRRAPSKRPKSSSINELGTKLFVTSPAVPEGPGSRQWPYTPNHFDHSERHAAKRRRIDPPPLLPIVRQPKQSVDAKPRLKAIRRFMELPVERPVTSKASSAGIDNPSDWVSQPNTHSNECHLAVFLCHARLYVLAERYDIQTLRSVALYRLHHALMVFRPYPERIEDVAALVPEIYGGTVMEDLARQVVASFFACHIEDIRQFPEFREALRADSDFADDLVQLIAQRVGESS